MRRQSGPLEGRDTVVVVQRRDGNFDAPAHNRGVVLT